MLFASFQSTLPWKTCDFASWADFRCEMKRLSSCNGTTDTLRISDGLCYNKTFFDTTDFNATGCFLAEGNKTVGCYFFTNENSIVRNKSTVLGYWDEYLSEMNNVKAQLSTEQFFRYSVLGQYHGFDTENIGSPMWGLTLSLLLAWILVFCSRELNCNWLISNFNVLGS